ncbi:MAG: hypothetical protein WA667_00990 [Candidatus Nitrosopolaris sp.]
MEGIEKQPGKWRRNRSSSHRQLSGKPNTASKRGDASSGKFYMSDAHWIMEYKVMTGLLRMRSKNQFGF